MKHIYILLSRTQTIPSKIVHSATGGAFTHASLALAPRTDRFFSYARRKLNNPLVAGLIVEDIHDGIFGRYPDANCSLFQLAISDNAYKKVKECIRYYFKNYAKAKYNFLGAIPQRLGFRWRRGFLLTCSQFVAVAINESDEISLPKDPYLMLPNDFLDIPNMKMIYEGPIKNLCF